MEGGQHRVHPQPPPQRVVAGEHTRLGVYHDVLRRLRDAGAAEACAPGFADRLWAHFHRFSVRYALEVNAERAEDVLVHMQLLDRAKSSETENRPAFSVRVVQVRCGPAKSALVSESASHSVSASSCDVFLSHLMCLVQVPPEIDATETDSAEPNPTEEGGDSATPRKLAYAASSLFTFQLITMRHRSSSF